MSPNAAECGAEASPGRVRRIGPLSAVVCNYNGEEYLSGCLDAILAQSEAFDEVLVVDNGSDDRSVDVLRERYPSVKLLLLPRNAGPCVARNAGMRAARNPWVLAVDNDAVLEPDVAGRLRAAIEESADVVAAQTRSVFFDDPERVHYDGGRFHYLGLYALRNFCRPLAEARGQGSVQVDGIVAIAVLLNRDVVLAHGGYDEDFFILFEDFDLSLRLRIAGLQILSVEDAMVRHRGGTPGISFRNRDYPKGRAYYHSCNRWLLMTKSYRLRTLLVASPGILVYELAWLVFAVAKGHLLAYLAGKVQFFRCLPAAVRRRGRVQAQRVLCDRELLVPGPLTLSPQLVLADRSRRMSALLSNVCAGWWRIVHRLAG